MADSAYITLDPEFEAILAKVAADPDSALLRVPRPQRIRGLFEREGVTEGGSVFSRAEKHLLQAYRSDVAALLLDVCRMKLLDGPRSRHHVSPYKTADRKHERLDPSGLAERLRREKGEACEVEGLAPAWTLLQACVAEPSRDEPTVSQLAEASIRLEPTDEARIMAAVDLIQREAPRTALHLLHHVVTECPRQENRFHAWNDLGMAYSFMGEPSKAHGCYVQACSVQTERVEPWMYRLIFGLQLGLFEDAREACETIDDLIGPDHDWLVNFAKWKTNERNHGDWSPTRESRSTLATLEPFIGPSARRITSAFE